MSILPWEWRLEHRFGIATLGSIGRTPHTKNLDGPQTNSLTLQMMTLGPEKVDGFPDITYGQSLVGWEPESESLTPARDLLLSATSCHL